MRLKIKKLPSIERLMELFEYDPSSGLVTRKITRSSRAIAGQVVCRKNMDGYLMVRAAEGEYLLHRVVFAMYHGYDPENEIDHINRDKADNRIENLREVSRSCNMRNRGTRSTNKSGVTGVQWNKCNNSWVATLQLGKISNYIGTSKDFTEAVAMRLAFEQCLWDGCVITTAKNYIDKYVMGEIDAKYGNNYR